MKCPVCASRKTVVGRVLGSEDGPGTRFYPNDIRFLALRRSVPLGPKQEFRACAACGHVWSHVDPYELQALIEERGNESLQAKLRAAEVIDESGKSPQK